MRIGIFSDIHANYEALLSVLTAYESGNIDLYMCAGDIVGYGASPNECVDLVRKVTSQVVCGNHDAAVSGLMNYSYYYEAARNVLDSHSTLLSDGNRDWLGKLTYTKTYSQHGIMLCHGSPIHPEEFDYVFSLDQALGILPFLNTMENITLIGHSHLCRVFELTANTATEISKQSFHLKEDKKYIISVGSVGQPRDYDNRASYTILDTDTREFHFKRVEYDIETAAVKIYEAGYEKNFANRLFIGV